VTSPITGPRARALLLGLIALASLPVRADEALTDWNEALTDAAQALSAEGFEVAETLARSALRVLPQGAAAARARLILGLALRGQKRFEEASESLRVALAGLRGDPALRPHTAYYYGDVLFNAGHAGAAAHMLAEVQTLTDGPLDEKARWREADALLAAGQPASAKVLYEKLLAANPWASQAPAARLALAGAYRTLGLPEKSVEQYQKLWLEHPSDPAGAAADKTLVEWQIAGGPVPNPTVDQQLERAERLLNQGQEAQLFAALDTIAAGGPTGSVPFTVQGMRILGMLQDGRRSEAESLAKKLAADEQAPLEARCAARLALARAASRSGRLDEAAGHYRDLANTPNLPRFPGMQPGQVTAFREEAAYMAAWLFYDAGKFDRAAEQLEQFLRNHPRARRADDARWFRFWSLYRMGKAAEAAEALASFGRGSLRSQALYWQGRIATEKEIQAEHYRQAYLEGNGGWYSLLASARLAQLKVPLPQIDRPPSKAVEPPSPDIQPVLARASALLAIGLKSDASAEIALLARGKRGRANAAALAQLAVLAGDVHLGYRLASDYLVQTPRALRWGYPEAYPDLVPANAKGFGVDPWMVLAVMRRESNFRAGVRSSAAAMGLLQLIRPTAERLATLLGLKGEVAERLGEPEVNIAFGAYYLSLLTSRFAEPALAIAAYNAGPRAVEGWLTAHPGAALDEWVESIPYRETRHYVKGVLADYAFYRRLYGAGEIAVDPDRKVPYPGPGVSF
jgi:soluble lytic murein transglycosylase